MDEVFLKIVNMSISASWLVLVVLVLRLLLKKAPKWVNVLLWGIVAVRLLCPFSIESALSLMRVDEAQAVAEGILDDYVVPGHFYWDNTVEYEEAVQSGIQPIYGGDGSYYVATGETPTDALATVADYAAPLWITGMAVMAAYTAVSYFRLRRKIRTAVRLDGNIYESDHIPSPFVLGILKPKIYLPHGMNDADLPHVIAHEQTHIRRRDHWWKPLGFLLLTIHWFNPLMWAAYVLLCRDIELACDEKVIQTQGRDQRADYSQALLACSVDRRMIAACPLAFGEVGVQDRVKNVLNYRKPAFWVIVMAVILCVAVAVCFLTDPAAPSPDELPLIHSHSYIAEEYAYQYTLRSFQYIPQVNTPVYAITEDMELLTKEDPVTWEWTSCGTLEKTELTKSDFRKMFSGDLWGKEGDTMDSFRENNANVWAIRSDTALSYYVFQQKNGDVYLAFGYFDPNNSAHELHCFKLAVDVSMDMGIRAGSGENMVPLTVFPAGTAVANYADSVQWLTIAPYESGEPPFVLYRDGMEAEAHYFVYDPETYEPLPHTVYEDVPSQTHIFENADLDKEYIIVAVFSTEVNAVQYCFGVRFPHTGGEPLGGGVTMWIDAETMDFASLYDAKITLPHFPNVTFRYTPGEITADNGNYETVLISGMPIWNACFADLTGDRIPEICATVGFGSGLVDTHVVVYDYANAQEYTLWDRGNYDYYLRPESGTLLCEQFTFENGNHNQGSLVASGELQMVDAGGGNGRRLEIVNTEDFYFSLSWGVEGQTSYDSRTGVLVKTTNTTHPEDYVTILALRPAEFQELYDMVQEMDLAAYPNQYDPFNDPAADTKKASKPSQDIILTIHTDTVDKTITCRNVLFFGSGEGYDDNAKRFLALCEGICDLVFASEEWQSLPDYENLYQ